MQYTKKEAVKKAVVACGKGGPGFPPQPGLTMTNPNGELSVAGPNQMPGQFGTNPNMKMGTMPQNILFGKQQIGADSGRNLIADKVGALNLARGDAMTAFPQGAAIRAGNYTLPKMPGVKTSPNESPTTPLKMKAVKNAVGRPTKNQDSLDNAHTPKKK